MARRCARSWRFSSGSIPYRFSPTRLSTASASPWPARRWTRSAASLVQGSIYWSWTASCYRSDHAHFLNEPKAMITSRRNTAVVASGADNGTAQGSDSRRRGPARRLHPVTRVVSKAIAPDLRQANDLLPAEHADAHAGIKDVLIISTPQDTPRFELTAWGWPPVGRQAAVCSASDAGRSRASVYPWARLHRFRTIRPYAQETTCSTAIASRSSWRKSPRGPRARQCLRIAFTIPSAMASSPALTRTGSRARSEEKPKRMRKKQDFAVTGLYFYDLQVYDFATAALEAIAAW